MPTAQPDGYLALPSTGIGRGVLVLHAWWGLNDTIRAVCARLAEAGFVAFAPDLYHGKVTDKIDEADTLSSALFDNVDQARTEAAAAAGFLSQRAGRSELGLAVIGFSLGAFFALDLSCAEPEQIRQVVLFYGAGEGDYQRARAAYLGHFAEADQYESQEYIDAMEAGLKQAGRSVTFYRYPGTGHWFFEPDRTDAFDAEAADLAWQRTLAFLSHSPAD